MQYTVNTPDEYITAIPEDRQHAIAELRKVINKNVPMGFDERMSYGVIGWVVPHNLYPPGYHCDPKLPLPFMSIASQKNFIAVYHMGVYANPELYNWFITEYPKYVKTKLDMGKSCIRFKKPEHIPYDLIGELAKKMTPKEWIECYESGLKK